jgi:predicted nucleotidyltransferase
MKGKTLFPYPSLHHFRLSKKPIFEKEGSGAFIKNALHFAEAASRLPGVLRIALIGSITTSKPKPKDVDLLVVVSEDVSIKSLATLGRKLLGKQMAVCDSSGADVFLANEDTNTWAGPAATGSVIPACAARAAIATALHQ